MAAAEGLAFGVTGLAFGVVGLETLGFVVLAFVVLAVFDLGALIVLAVGGGRSVC